MSVEELVLRPAVEVGAAIARGEVSSVEVVEGYLARAKRLARLNAYITLDEEGALEQARRADVEIGKGIIKGPLHGVPVGIKDQFDVRGLRTTAGSKIVDYVATEDATAVARLREAGAIILGKLNLSEFALGGNVTHPFGVPHNPWDESRQAGQSSSGSGIAVAASLCAAALGGDTAGSIRSPSAWCGITGLRPTWGRVSRAGAWPMAWFMDTIGPMAWTVADCAAIFEAIAGWDERDRLTSRRALGETPSSSPLAKGRTGGDSPTGTPSSSPFARGRTGGEHPLAGVRVGLVKESVEGGMASEVVARGVEAALEVLRGLGAEVVEVSLPLFEHGGLISNGLADVEAAFVHRKMIREHAEEYDFASRRRLMAASLISGTAYAKLQRFRMLMRRDVMAALGQAHVLVTPCQPEVAPKIATSTGLTSKEAVMRQFFGTRAHRGPFNLSGVPAMALPMGFSEPEETPSDSPSSKGRTGQGLPLSLQVVGRPFDEGSLFRVGSAFQGATDWHERRPVLD